MSRSSILAFAPLFPNPRRNQCLAQTLPVCLITDLKYFDYHSLAKRPSYLPFFHPQTISDFQFFFHLSSLTLSTSPPTSYFMKPSPLQNFIDHFKPWFLQIWHFSRPHLFSRQLLVSEPLRRPAPLFQSFLGQWFLPFPPSQSIHLSLHQFFRL